VKRQPTRKCGFTLLELLVVVSIIALLMALLMPSLRRAREQSKQLVCRKNLTNMWRGVLVYSTEYNDRVPYLERIDQHIDPFDPNHPTLIGTVLGPYVDRSSFVCPSAVAGFPETDPESKRKWKLTYDFSTADRLGSPVPYDRAPGAFSGVAPDPAVVNNVHFDGRPLRTITVQRASSPSLANTPEDNPSDEPNAQRAEVIWSVSVPLIADRLGEYQPGDIEAGRPIYPHRGIVRRQQDVYRSLVATSDPRLVSESRPGYFQLHAEGDRAELLLTRFSPDRNPDDD
jgi:prepilin-type N-terminal cleavage/methylation domain-containing protein